MTMKSERNHAVPRLRLNDGHEIPQLGFGVWQIENKEAPKVVVSAIDAGFRLIDTATNYGNEAGVGEAVRLSPVARSELYVTTKLWNDSHGYAPTLRAFEASAQRLGLNVIDLYLIHWPCPQTDAYVETWRAFVELQRMGRVRSIGVSNFTAENLKRLIGETGVVPAVNQIEVHPSYQQLHMREIHRSLGILTQSWSPLGQGKCLRSPVLEGIANRCGRTGAQVVLRWHIESGLIAIPKSGSSARIAENINLFDFELTANDHRLLAGLDRSDGRIGPDPSSFGRMRFTRRIQRRVRSAFGFTS